MYETKLGYFEYSKMRQTQIVGSTAFMTSLLKQVLLNNIA